MDAEEPSRRDLHGRVYFYEIKLKPDLCIFVLLLAIFLLLSLASLYLTFFNSITLSLPFTHYFSVFSNQHICTYRIICIVADNGLSKQILSMKLCRALFSIDSVAGNPRQKSGISLTFEMPTT